MKKHIIDIVRLVDESIARLNKQNKDAGTNKHYSVEIKNGRQPDQNNVELKKGGKKTKVLNLYLHDLETKERLSLFDTTYIPKSPADLLTTNYKVLLYRELIYTGIAFIAINLENVKREQQMNRAIEHATKLQR